MPIFGHFSKALVRQNCQELPIFRAKTFTTDENLIF